MVDINPIPDNFINKYDLLTKVMNGKVIRLKHFNSDRILHYENYTKLRDNDKVYGKVIGTFGREYGDWWKVETENSNVDNTGIIYNGSVIKLMHMISGKYLVYNDDEIDCIKIENKIDEIDDKIDDKIDNKIDDKIYKKIDNKIDDDEPDINSNLWVVVVVDEPSWETNSIIKLINMKSGAKLNSRFEYYKSGEQIVYGSFDDTNKDNDNELWVTAENCFSNQIMDNRY